MKHAKKDWQRARRPEQKQERVDTILDAAATLLDEEGLEGTGLNAIAREAGMSKPNLYRYFESREAILLAVLLKEAEAWGRALAKRLSPLAGSSDIVGVSGAFAATLVRRRRFCELFQAVASVLEHNVSRETVVEYKRDFLRIADPAVHAFQAALPRLSLEEAFQALGVLVMSATGVWPHAHPPAVLRDVMSEPEFAGLKIEFQPTVEAHADAYLRGLLSRPGRNG